MDKRRSQDGYSDSPTNRLKEWRIKRGLSLKKLGALVDLSFGQVRKLESGEQQLKLSWLRPFAKALNCRPVDLLPAEDLEPALKSFDPNTVSAMAWPVPLRREGGDAFGPQDCIWFGYDFLVELKIDPQKCEAILIPDSSMAAAFPAGSTCLVDHQRQKREPLGVYAVEFKGEPLIRRARKQSNRWHLVADNPEAEWEDVPWDATLQPLGRVVWTSRVTVS